MQYSPAQAHPHIVTMGTLCTLIVNTPDLIIVENSSDGRHSMCVCLQDNLNGKLVILVQDPKKR